MEPCLVGCTCPGTVIAELSRDKEGLVSRHAAARSGTCSLRRMCKWRTYCPITDHTARRNVRVFSSLPEGGWWPRLMWTTTQNNTSRVVTTRWSVKPADTIRVFANRSTISIALFSNRNNRVVRSGRIDIGTRANTLISPFSASKRADLNSGHLLVDPSSSQQKICAVTTILYLS